MTESPHASPTPRPHHLILEDRKHLSLSGVIDIKQFEEDSALLVTSLGLLTLTGSDFRLIKSDTDTGEVIMEGHISELYYTDQLDDSEGKKRFGWFLGQR